MSRDSVIYSYNVEQNWPIITTKLWYMQLLAELWQSHKTGGHRLDEGTWIECWTTCLLQVWITNCFKVKCRRDRLPITCILAYQHDQINPSFLLCAQWKYQTSFHSSNDHLICQYTYFLFPDPIWHLQHTHCIKRDKNVYSHPSLHQPLPPSLSFLLPLMARGSFQFPTFNTTTRKLRRPWKNSTLNSIVQFHEQGWK